MEAANSLSSTRSAAEWLVPTAAVATVFVMLVPVPAFLLDLFLATSVTLGVVVLLSALYILRPVQFSVFPTLLLFLTLFRISLNIASSRRILLHGAEGAAAAGNVIQAFGQFVVGGNYVVGFVIFLALIAIQYLVINHGAVRTAEVAARFTLDALPGKQMAIDADLNAGLIDEGQARARRELVGKEAEFYGAMDGAARFSQRDALATILITAINIIAGFLIGVFQLNIPFAEAAKTYTVLTVGDGLVTMIPSFLVSVAGGIVVTRASSGDSVGVEFGSQLFGRKMPLRIAAGVMLLLGLIPGLPKFSFFLLAAVTAYLSSKAPQAGTGEVKKAEVVAFGTGVQLQQVVSLRDSILDLRINQETQQQGQLNGFLGGAQQIQTLFNEAGGTGLQSDITAFFNSLSQLSTNPSDLNLRQAVITAAQNLASAFNSASNSLSTLQRNTDLSVTQSVAQINTLTKQIAALNQQVSATEAAEQNAGPFIDQRQQLINQLSNLVDVSEINAGNGSLTLTTRGGAALVVGGQNFALTTQTNASGFQDIVSQGSDITASISGGQLAGQLQIRDQDIPSLQSTLDALAGNLASAVNTQHQAGFDLNGAAGGNFFVPPPAGNTGAAAGLRVAIADPRKLAASGDGSAGDNTNASALAAIQNQNIVNGLTPIGAYSGVVFKIGNDVQSAQSNLEAGSLVLQQLKNLQGGISGVDINEESANLIRFQNAYTASAQVASVISTLLQTTINMVQP